MIGVLTLYFGVINILLSKYYLKIHSQRTQMIKTSN